MNFLNYRSTQRWLFQGELIQRYFDLFYYHFHFPYYKHIGMKNIDSDINVTISSFSIGYIKSSINIIPLTFCITNISDNLE